MVLPKHHATNLETLREAFKQNAVCVMECRRKSDGATVALLCAVGWDGKEYAFSPFAEMVNGNPFDLYDPPVPGGGFEGDKVTRQ
jgi:hypothetical protein